MQLIFCVIPELFVFPKTVARNAKFIWYIRSIKPLFPIFFNVIRWSVVAVHFRRSDFLQDQLFSQKQWRLYTQRVKLTRKLTSHLASRGCLDKRAVTNLQCVTFWVPGKAQRRRVRQKLQSNINLANWRGMIALGNLEQNRLSMAIGHPFP